jgi:branched-chain amino acid transport system permease protein
MVGAFCCFLAATRLHLPFVPVLLASMAAVALLGVLIERLAYKPLRNAPRVSAIITALGVGIFLENFTMALSPYPQSIPRELFHNTTWTVGGLTVSALQVLIIVASVVLMVALDFIVQRTKVGMAMRAIAWDQAVVPLMGVPVDLVISITFALGAGLGGGAGVMYGLAYSPIDANMGIMIGWKAFIAAVVGGIGNIRGAMLGGYILGALEVLVMAYGSSTYRDFIAFSLLLVLLVFRPYGLLGTPKVQKV